MSSLTATANLGRYLIDVSAWRQGTKILSPRQRVTIEYHAQLPTFVIDRIGIGGGPRTRTSLVFRKFQDPIRGEASFFFASHTDFLMNWPKWRRSIFLPQELPIMTVSWVASSNSPIVPRAHCRVLGGGYQAQESLG